jgi:hypothetical protein
MFEHHQKTIENLKEHFEPNPEYLALIVIGSVARGDAMPDSDVDFYLVVDHPPSQDGIEAHECCVPPCTEAGGALLTKASLREIRDHGNEIARWAFFQAKTIFSRDPEIEQLMIEILRYPESGRTRRMESYYSQIFYHFSFFEYAFYSQTKYLIYETATKMILATGRLILADNRMLYPNRKRFFSELKRAPDKPEGICEAMLDFLDKPTIEAGNRIIQMIQSYKTYPSPAEGIGARNHKENILNLEEW